MEAVRGGALKRDLALVGLGAASAATYALIARAAGAPGFPLDDAWIHQTYARNLGWHGQWAFTLGQPSAGSTAPLWTFLLAIGYALRIDYAIWTPLLNSALLGVTAWLTYRLAAQVGKAPGTAWWVGALAAVEWHLVWAASSGMETLLFCALAMGVWVFVGAAVENRFYGFGGGLLTGLSVWARPDGLTLLPFAGWLVGTQGGDGIQRAKRLGWLIGGAALALIPYFLFNLALSGQMWPNTFFAKQAEYAFLREAPLWKRVVQISVTPFVGTLALLLPGIALGARKWWIQLTWVAAFLFAYAWRLPVSYQHGRYLIPVVPVLVAAGASGMMQWVLRQPWPTGGLRLRATPGMNAPVIWRRVTSRAWVLGTGAVTLAFWGLGANALVTDVRVINAEMVATAQWVAAYLPRGTVVAAHDIGALGYFADVQLIDLAGLVSPDVIPLMGDDTRLWTFIRKGRAQYLVTYPGWCPSFANDVALRPVFQTGPLCNPVEQNLHMTVYQLP